MSTRLNYWDYLKLDTLLSLQSGYEDDDDKISEDELHFIVVHQSYELWFKLIIRSLRLARDHLAAPKVSEETIPHVVHHLRRINATLQLMVNQWKVMETLTPQDFLAFRDKLSPASGFQSFQMRAMEVLIGLEDAQRVRYGNVDQMKHIEKHSVGTKGGEYAWNQLQRARSETSILAALNDWLYRTPIQGSSPGEPGDEEHVIAFLNDYLGKLAESHDAQLAGLVDSLGEEQRDRLIEKFSSIRSSAREFMMAEDIDEAERSKTRRVRAAALFIESYRDLPLLAWPRLLLDMVVEMEENLLLFRHAHVRMVERLIGRRVGTGGSSGVDYLDKTLKYRVFRDLWAIRTVLLARALVPEPQNLKFYGFASPE